jgi:16S rRNA (adenine(1408)-N(1))-methyltransferase
VVIDIGTGDGRAVLARARATPCDLVLGIDAAAASMREASRRAAARPARGGLANARFFVEAAEALPGPLAGTADLVTITMPWGSLLRGVLGRDTAVMTGIAGLLAAEGSIELLVSVTARDAVDGIATLSADDAPTIAAAWSRFGLRLVTFQPAMTEEIVATGSSWARRLGERPVWRLELHP